MDNQNNVDNGRLRLNVTTDQGYTPIANARIELSFSSEPTNVIEVLETDSSGNTPVVNLESPPIEYSLEPSDNQPYSLYNARINAEYYEEQYISGIQILPNVTGLQSVRMPLNTTSDIFNPIVISGHTLWEEYPPKIPEDIIKPIDESGEIVLSSVVIPETIVVHDGVPTDTTAKNYYIPYLDYIKNVASCEIYSTWSESAIQANILAIMSLTLNRVYTEWYRNRNYNFTITSSTAFDQKWIYGKTIYEEISIVADSLYNNYLAKPNVSQPLFTQYCDGKRVTCPNWMSQWGSKSLADDGLTASQILRYYYGNDIYINSAEYVSGIPSSYPGYDLTIGSSGDPVITIQEQLNRISKNYPAIPSISVDGIYGTNTANAVSTFQGIFDLPQTGIVDYPTWYKISQIYVGVTKIAEYV